MTPPIDASARVLAVVVVYQTSLTASKTLSGLSAAFAEDPELRPRLEVLVWDNSPQPLEHSTLGFTFHYRHAEKNCGVAGAYNAAAEIARGLGCQWLLLLDHDTSVTVAFLRGTLDHARENAADDSIAAVAPFLYADAFPLSPRLWRFARHQPLPRPAAPYTEHRALFAANSGTLMRIAALDRIGGYSPRFWLDYSDIYVFEQLHRAGLRVRIASDLALQHEIAMLDYDTRMTPERYATYLAAEGEFLDLYRGMLERGMHLLRLAARVVRQRRYANPVFSHMTLACLWMRLVTGRRRRLRKARLLLGYWGSS